MLLWYDVGFRKRIYKNFVLMGISFKNRKLTITNNNNISLSNLNR